MLGWIFAGGILFWGSIYDMKSLCLPLWLVVLGLVGGLAGVVCFWVEGSGYWWEVLSGLLPGILFLVLAFLTKEQIGYGDGLVLLMLGGCLDSRIVFGVWMSGLLVSFLIGVVLLISRKAERRSRLPYVPCLFVGYLVMGIGEVTNVL